MKNALRRGDASDLNIYSVGECLWPYNTLMHGADAFASQASFPSRFPVFSVTLPSPRPTLVLPRMMVLSLWWVFFILLSFQLRAPSLRPSSALIRFSAPPAHLGSRRIDRNQLQPWYGRCPRGECW